MVRHPGRAVDAHGDDLTQLRVDGRFRVAEAAARLPLPDGDDLGENRQRGLGDGVRGEASASARSVAPTQTSSGGGRSGSTNTLAPSRSSTTGRLRGRAVGGELHLARAVAGEDGRERRALAARDGLPDEANRPRIGDRRDEDVDLAAARKAEACAVSSSIP